MSIVFSIQMLSFEFVRISQNRIVMTVLIHP